MAKSKVTAKVKSTKPVESSSDSSSEEEPVKVAPKKVKKPVKQESLVLEGCFLTSFQKNFKKISKIVFSFLKSHTKKS